ncbi:hypothetical protein HNY73_011723 [Argiope bruennichi]|uniref:Uncharacterized protein n=1 Tax=Argiope bruennichi TaxID=94029 RepID=A0A8T0EZ26_ARGBR|nr:hypothetical protein HNY73_011723 [Argiope bruennichi]
MICWPKYCDSSAISLCRLKQDRGCSGLRPRGHTFLFYDLLMVSTAKMTARDGRFDQKTSSLASRLISNHNELLSIVYRTFLPRTSMSVFFGKKGEKHHISPLRPGLWCQD